MSEIPQLSNYAYANTTLPDWSGTTATPVTFDFTALEPHQRHWHNPLTPAPQPEPVMPEKSTRRLVKVLIADIDPDVPMKECLLYRGDETFTDATDQELFFEVDIKGILTQHNTKRVTWLDKEATKKAGKDVFLEPVRIRDLRMVVVEIAKF